MSINFFIKKAPVFLIFAFSSTCLGFSERNTSHQSLENGLRLIIIEDHSAPTVVQMTIVQAGSIDEMNEILRDQFVKLYDEENVLEDLSASLNVLYPGVEFPEVPDRGVFELDSVKGSKYFFA